MVLITPSTAARGQTVGHGLNRGGEPVFLGMVSVDFLIHQRFHLVRFFGAETDYAKAVAHECQRVVIGMEIWELPKQIAVLGVFHMGFKRQHAFRLGQLEHLELHAEKFDKIVFFVWRTFKGHAHGPAELLDHGHRTADDESADRGPDDDHGLKWLP